MGYDDNVMSMKSLVNNLINQLGISEQVYLVKLKNDWSEIIGELVASKIHVENLKDQMLYLTTSVSVWRNELLLRKEEIIQKINSKYEKNIVKDIIIR